MPPMQYQKDKQGKNPIYYSDKKNTVPMNKPNQGGQIPVLRKLHNTKEIKEDTNKQKHIPCSWMEELTLKYPYYPKQFID